MFVYLCNDLGGSISDHGEAYSVQHYGIKFVSDLRQVGGFLLVLRFPLLIDITEIVLIVALS